MFACPGPTTEIVQIDGGVSRVFVEASCGGVAGTGGEESVGGLLAGPLAPDTHRRRQSEVYRITAIVPETSCCSMDRFVGNTYGRECTPKDKGLLGKTRLSK